MLFEANIALEREVFVAAIMTAFLYIYTLLMYTNTHSVEAEKQLCSVALTSARKKAFCKFCAHVIRGS